MRHAAGSSPFAAPAARGAAGAGMCRAPCIAARARAPPLAGGGRPPQQPPRRGSGGGGGNGDDEPRRRSRPAHVAALAAAMKPRQGAPPVAGHPLAADAAAIARVRAESGDVDDPHTLLPDYLRPSYAEERKPPAAG
jgi:hypothetical protein